MRRALLLLPVLLVLAPRTAHASPLELFGFGGRSPALAATGVADAVGFDCVYLNPAGLAEVKRKRLSFGTLLGDFNLSGVTRTVETAVGAELGAELPLPLGGALAGRVGIGLGFYIPTAVLVTARAPMPGDPFFALLENRSRVVGIQVGVGVRITDHWSAGVGVLALAALRGAIHVEADAAGRFTSVSEQQLISHFAPIFGVRWRAMPRLRTGLTLRFPSKSSYDILVTNDLAKALPVTLPELRFAGVAQYDPLILAAEATWSPAPAWSISGQLAYERWSAFPLPTENPVAEMPPQAAPGFHDTVVPRVAAERRLALGGQRLALRGGYFFVWSPAPEMTGEQAFLDNHRHAFSLGAGLSAADGAGFPYHVDLWFQAHLLQPRSHDRPDGEADIDTSGSILVGGLMLGVDL